MTDVLTLVRALEGPPAPPDPPAWPAHAHGTRRVVLPLVVATVALAAGAIAWLRPSAVAPVSPPDPGLRGLAGGVEVDLRLAVERPGGLERVRRDAACRLGDRVFVQVAASRDAPVAVWVEGPAGTERIAEVEAGREPVDVRLPGGWVAYEFTLPGPHTFVASPEGFGTCTPPACFRQTVEAR